MALSAPAMGVAGDTIKFGVAGPHSGDLASYGLPTVNAAKLVIDKVNANGGINGKKVEMLIEDDVCKPEISTNTATKLVSDGAEVVLGHICSGATIAAMPIYKNAGILVVSPSATSDELTLSGNYPNFFRTIAPNAAQSPAMIDFAVDKLGLTKIAIIHDKGDYGKPLAEGAKKHVEQKGKGEVVLFEGITPGAMDYSAIVQKIKQSGAQVVVFGGYHPEASKIVTIMKKKRLDTAFVSDDGVKDDTFIKVAGESAEGVYAAGPQDNSANPLAAEAKEAHKKAFGSDPGAFFEGAYAATVAMLNAIDKADSTKLEDLKKVLQSEKVDTPVGKINFNEKGDAIGVGFSMYVVEKGKYVVVK
ncbi:MAG: branched chain amino acid ABC transporter substrate-binding protein [Desulfobacterales bacterium GWB2_56_26]|nr:MAG: branched chain amino acid ABC transporter substrate-binding protein [Desulfobacterales bacterium GWB2_56_26]